MSPKNAERPLGALVSNNSCVLWASPRCNRWRQGACLGIAWLFTFSGVSSLPPFRAAISTRQTLWVSRLYLCVIVWHRNHVMSCECGIALHLRGWRTRPRPTLWTFHSFFSDLALGVIAIARTRICFRARRALSHQLIPSKSRLSRYNSDSMKQFEQKISIEEHFQQVRQKPQENWCRRNPRSGT